MSMKARKVGPVVEATVGYAADRYGRGLAYIAIKRSPEAPLLLRASFFVKRQPGLGGREVGYAALAKAASLLSERNVRRARFGIADSELVADMAEHREVAPPLMLPYIKLGCALNQFADFHIEPASTDDLTARARAELALTLAA
jgi:hypothetical protein